MNQKERREQRQKMILEAAMHDFVKVGYEKVSMESLSRHPGISKGTLYHYFQSKDEIFLACARETFDQLKMYLEANQGKLTIDQGKERIAAYFMLRESFFNEHPVLMGIFEIAMVRPPKHLTTAISEIREPLQKMNQAFLNTVISHMKLRNHLEPARALAYLEIMEKYFWDLLPKQDMDLHEMFQKVGELLDMLLFGIVVQEPTE